MSSFWKRLRHELFDRRVSPVGLAMFRIAYSAVLLGEVAHLYWLRHLVFDPIPFLKPSEIRLEPALLAWMAAVCCLLVGWRTRTAAVVNLAYTLLTFGAFRDFEYHVDYGYSGINLLLPFLPVAECLSVDAFLERGRRERSGPVPVSVFYYHAPVVVGIALVYLDSVGYKLASPMWLSGLGLWRPSSYPHATWLIDPSWLLDQKLLAVSLGYVVLIFEIAFSCLFFWSAFRAPIFALGVTFHLAITIVFPIPFFGLTVAALYTLLLPYGWYERLDRLLVRRNGVEVDSTNLAGRVETHPAGSSLRVSMVVCLTLCAILLQSLQFARTPVAKKVASRAGLQRLQQYVAGIAVQWHPFSRSVFGCTPHAVFMDGHFQDHDHVVTLQMTGEPGSVGPVDLETGMTQWPYTGRIWVYWTFRAVGTNVESKKLRSEIARFTAFHAVRSGRGLSDVRYRILVRTYDAPEGWESGFHHRQRAKPWVDVGEARWKDGEFEAEFLDVEGVR